jgi:hypothetical protein
MFNDYSAIGVFAGHQDAENAIRELQRAGFDIKKLSILASIMKRKSMQWGTTIRAIACATGARWARSGELSGAGS